MERFVREEIKGQKPRKGKGKVGGLFFTKNVLEEGRVGGGKILTFFPLTAMFLALRSALFLAASFF